MRVLERLILFGVIVNTKKSKSQKTLRKTATSLVIATKQQENPHIAQELIGGLTGRKSYVGCNISSKTDADQIVSAGITHVIDMRAEFDDDMLNDNRITILWLPQPVDDGTLRPPGQYRKGIQFAFPALSLANTKVFLHCSAGLNRGPTMCYALLRAFGFSQVEAISRIRAVRPEVVFYLVQNYLDSVERDLAS